jgi:hypothetical protein
MSQCFTVERELEPKTRKKRVPGHPETNIEGDTKPRGIAGPLCMTCSHGRRAEIERAILDGVPWYRIARTITDGHPGQISIKKHAQDCIPEIMSRRREKIQSADDLSAELITQHIRESMEQAQQSAEIAFDEDEHGVIREAAQGRSAAIRTRIEAARAGGEIVGLFKSGTKVEVLLKAPETQEFLTRLVDLLCPHCAILLQSELDKTGE